MTLEEARIDHIRALGEYTVAWFSGDPNAILTSWDRVKATKATTQELQKQQGEKDWLRAGL